jgi:transcriptional regulator with XRE-family HTH domain
MKNMAYRLKQDVSIGVNLKKYRTQSGMSQENVAAKLQTMGLDISREIISQMELGKYNIRVSVLLALADLYRTPIQNFFAGLDIHE